MKTGENRPEIRPKADSLQIRKEEAKQKQIAYPKQEAKSKKIAKSKQFANQKHKVNQNNGFSNYKSEENAINQGCLQKRPSAQLNKRACVILSLIKNTDNRMCFLEREEGTRYVDTYSG